MKKIQTKTPKNLRKAGNIHKYMDWKNKKEKRELKSSKEKFEAMEYLKNKYNYNGLAYAKPKNWDKKDKELFIKIWVLDGYSEGQIKRMYDLY